MKYRKYSFDSAAIIQANYDRCATEVAENQGKGISKLKDLL